MKEEKSQEKEIDPLGPKTVFTIKHSELKGLTQCKNGEHSWVKLNEAELKCTKCNTAIIVGIDNIEQYL